MRDQTEWVELVDIGANELVGADSEVILEAARRNVKRKVADVDSIYGGGNASERIVEALNN